MWLELLLFPQLLFHCCSNQIGSILHLVLRFSFSKSFCFSFIFSVLSLLDHFIQEGRLPIFRQAKLSCCLSHHGVGTKHSSISAFSDISFFLPSLSIRLWVPLSTVQNSQNILRLLLWNRVLLSNKILHALNILGGLRS